MKDTEKRALEKSQKKAGLKNMYFNRYLLVRYIVATLFFANLYWMLFLSLAGSTWAVIPFALIAFSVLVLAEQVRIYNKHTNMVPRLKAYSYIQLGINICLLPTVPTSLYTHLFPFAANDATGKRFILVFLAIGVFLCGILIRKIYLIQTNQDKQFFRIKEYKKAIGV
ncbi:MAG: hypothetical protein QM613_02375 [Micrococcaceae bacterium]